VPAIDETGGFFLFQLSQLEPGMFQPPLRHPALRLAIVMTPTTRSAHRHMEFRMVGRPYTVT
jgi:hypothetical protein